MRVPRPSGWTPPVAFAFAGALGLTARSLAQPAPEPPRVDATSIVAAMPEGVESVMIWNLPALRGQAPTLAQVFERNMVKGWQAPPQGDPTVRDRALAAVASAGVAVYADGGSDFKKPADIGVGDSNEQLLFVLEKPTAAVRAALDAACALPNVVKLDEEGVALYRGPYEFREYGVGPQHPVRKTAFVAVRDDVVIVVANSREDAVRMATAPLSGAVAPGDKWKPVAADLATDSGLVIARVYDRRNRRDVTSPIAAGARGADVTAVALRLTAADPAFQMHCVTREAGPAAAFYDDHIMPKEYFGWAVTADDDGFVANITAHADPSAQQVVPLSLLMLFGLNIAI